MLFCLQITAPHESYDQLTGLLSVYVPTGWQEETLSSGDIRITLYDTNQELLDTLAKDLSPLILKAEQSECQERDWQKQWLDSLHPRTIGAFIVVPHGKVEDSSDHIPLYIEPKNAFGTGEHQTTALCLRILSHLATTKTLKTPFLDLGTGSGILAIAAAKLGLDGVGLDIEADAIQCARENAEKNAVAHAISLKQGSIEEVHGQRFGLVFANILANPLRSMANDLAACVAEEGSLILSGFLDIQCESLSALYTDLGFHCTQYEDGEWSALLCTHA
ncbi:MAG: 50S ribosomal protein L11 methyltransferase [Desulfovibrio sp.]|nr:50S ribosomal protein L11 methyltransferase [Desulfovibrio sp.]